jgi:hypothetical protein
MLTFFNNPVCMYYVHASMCAHAHVCVQVCPISTSDKYSPTHSHLTYLVTRQGLNMPHCTTVFLRTKAKPKNNISVPRVVEKATNSPKSSFYITHIPNCKNTIHQNPLLYDPIHEHIQM